MAPYDTFQPETQAPAMRRWIFSALILSLLLHGGLFVFLRAKRLENFGMSEVETLAPPKFVVNKVSIDPRTLQEPEEIKATLKDRPKTLPKIDVPIEKIEPLEITAKPGVAEIASPILNDKPKTSAVNTDLLAKVEAASSGAREKGLDSIATGLLKESARAPKQSVVFTLPKNSSEVGGGVGENEGIAGLRSLDDAIAATGPLASGERLGVRGGALFPYNQADLLQEAIDDLQKLGEIIKRNARATFSIEGHTDAIGTPEYNLDLSRRRAESVKSWLVANMAIAPERIQTVGFGSTKLLVPGDRSVDEQAPNRRVEIVIKTNAKR